MTVDTIKNVLMRILSINKNMTEDSLNNLLVASGWDKSDIKEGMNIYGAYKLSGGDSGTITDYKQVKQNEDGQEITTNTVSIPQDKNEMKYTKYEDEDDRGNGAEKDLLEKKEQDKKDENKTNVISLLEKDNNTSAENVATQIVNVEHASAINNASAIDPTDMLKKSDTPYANIFNHESHIDAAELDAVSKKDKSIFLIAVDIVLFFLTLALLFYILLS